MGDRMKISIEEINKELAEEILIRCHEVDDEINEIVNKLEIENLIVLGYQNDQVHRIKLSDIYYFEAVDGKVYVYCKDDVFEVKQKLYELEELCKEKNCFRASKSTILNIAKISSIYPSISGRFEAVLDNGERAVVSRQYVPVLKNRLGLK
ncbi:LytTR family DNA-binding domain-containing protein [Bacillus sp. OK048]|uniref:LytTR family DNA-binding domain-containing protein n=1 Tax=Bacillus sp. OK048 TaxID=1882761 RepID=UPI000891181F|nr:LytTR family DNA-binding domain-containing protein [Bacillus sp. OK048]SDN04606.1 transcriptional regulator, LytTR family [Bacillus sp. OK048]